MTAGTSAGPALSRGPRPSAGPQQAGPSGRAKRSLRTDGPAGYFFLSPWILGMLLLTLGPMLASLYLSFTDYNLFTAPEWVGLQNYVDMFADQRWRQSVLVTLTYVVISAPLKLAVAQITAMYAGQATAGENAWHWWCF